MESSEEAHDYEESFESSEELEISHPNSVFSHHQNRNPTIHLDNDQIQQRISRDTKQTSHRTEEIDKKHSLRH